MEVVINKKLPLISLFIMSIISIFYWTFKPKELYEAKWNAPDTTLAITVDGEISTTFPTKNTYKTNVTDTTFNPWGWPTNGLGYAYNKHNATTYLQENATDYSHWWSMSPQGFYNGNASG